MAGDKPNPTQRPAPARGPGGGALQQRKRPARTASGGRRPAAQPGILRFYAEETPGLKIGPTTVTRRVTFYLLQFIATVALSFALEGRIDGVEFVEISPARHRRDRRRMRLTPRTRRYW